MTIKSPQIALFVSSAHRPLVRDLLGQGPNSYHLHDIIDLASLPTGRSVTQCRALVAEVGAGAVDPFELIQFYNEAAPELPVILLATEDDSALAQRCLAAGATDFITYSWLFRLPAALDNAIMRSDERWRQFEVEALQRANNALAKLSRRKDEFLANVSHELRTPLNNMLLAAQMLETGIYGQLAEKQARAVDNIVTGGNHLLNLINDILDLARIESGNVELEMGQVDLHRLADMSRSLLQETAHHKGVRLDVQVVSAIDSVPGDYRRLLQVVVNLLGNAVKFTPAGRDVGLTIQSDVQAGHVVLIVWDQGIGIADADLDDLFKPFARARTELIREIEGTGLGLALVAQLVDMHNGSIRVESTLGEGTRFTIALPLPDAAGAILPSAELNETAEKLLSERFREATVLIVDDNVSNRETMADFCGAGGCTVVTAADGLQALELVRQHRPDVVVMDVRMPVMNGLDAIRHLRADADPAIANVPVVIYTARAMPGDEQICLEAGATAYFSKPINLSQMKKRIMRLVGADLLSTS